MGLCIAELDLKTQMIISPLDLVGVRDRDVVLLELSSKLTDVQKLNLFLAEHHSPAGWTSQT